MSSSQKVEYPKYWKRENNPPDQYWSHQYIKQADQDSGEIITFCLDGSSHVHSAHRFIDAYQTAHTTPLNISTDKFEMLCHLAKSE